jgi:CBS domain-containing protein
MICPQCGFENLEGADECDGCRSSLTEEGGVPTAGAGWQKKIMKDAINKVSVRDPIIVKPGTNVKKVIRQMKEKHIGCVLVVEKGNLVGIFTERDVLHKTSQPEMDLSDIEIDNVMTPSPEVLGEKDTIAFALNKMAMGNFRHVPIQREDGSIYALCVRDVLRYVF